MTGAVVMFVLLLANLCAVARMMWRFLAKAPPQEAIPWVHRTDGMASEWGERAA